MKLPVQIVASLALAGSLVASAKTYEANWESLNSRPCPQWWKDAKFGVFIHWGTYAVPAYAPAHEQSVYDCYAEWYGGKLESGDPSKPSPYAKHQDRFFHGKSYADLAADFKARQFDPARWAKVFQRSGAKYVVLTSKHHEGFPLWKCSTSPYYNAVAMGPQRDICGELTKAVKDAGLHMGFYYSLLEWHHPLFNPAGITNYVREVNFPQLKELVTNYRPDIVWTDGEWNFSWEVFRSPEFLAWLYNESPVRDTVVANDRWGKQFRGKCGDHYTTEYDDATLSGKDAAAHPWEECRGMGRSFGYNRTETAEDYLTDEACIETLCEKVSRGGNLLLNIGPDAEGNIPPIMEERLLAMGRWLKVNGEAIYGTTAWEKRPKTMRSDRVYLSKKGATLYAIVFGSRERFTVKGVGAVKGVALLGSGQKIDWKQTGDDVTVEMPLFRQGAAPGAHALAFRLTRD